MRWTSDSVLSGVPFCVFLWCGDMHRNYTFSLCSGLPTYDAVTPNVYVARGQRMLLFQRDCLMLMFTWLLALGLWL